MRYLILSYFLFFLIFSMSCTKEESLIKDDGLVKTIDSIVMDTHIGCIPLEDDNFLVVSQGQMVKLSNSGKILWKKNVSPFNLRLLNVISIPGTGFASIGLDNSITMFICVYDNDGNFLSKKALHMDSPSGYGVGVTEFIRLSNGNYAIATSTSYTWCGYLKILDHDFNLLHSRAFCAPANYYSLTIQRISETPDGGVAVTATIGSASLENNFINTLLILTESNGVAKSITVLNDSLINEVPTAVAPGNNGFFAITSKMIGWETGNGAFVEYNGLTSIAGRIAINRFSPDGQFTGLTEFNDYPGYGLINSIRKTKDGGYILCGTVNNLGSSISVSKTKIYLCKINANLDKQWSKVIQTIYQTIGVDAVPTSDGGYQVTGNMKSFDTYNKMILIKTDAYGNY